MKIYTFGALENTRVEILWSLKSDDRDQIFAQYINQSNYLEVDSIQDCQIAIYPRRAFDPETLEFDSGVYDAARLAQKYDKPLIIDATSDSDVLIDIPNAYILRCGLYKSLKQPFETECPFWSNYRTKAKLDALEISSKPQKPTVGFCGTTASIGNLSNITKLFIPNAIAIVLLSQGKRSAQIDIRVREGMSLKLRETAMKLLALDQRLDTNFALTNNYQSYYCKDENNRVTLENLFIDNTRKADYILCVRGTGNYSGRFYMALNAGKIPIVVDTDIVIPFEDKLHLVKVPLNSLNKIGDIVLEHFEKTTESEFKEIKALNRQVYHQFLAPEKFFPDFINNIV
jgi:hypothetical protein